MSDQKTTGDCPEPTPRRLDVRGILSRLVLFKQLENPRDHLFWEKAVITFVVAVAGAAAPIGSSIVLPALDDIADHFDASLTVVNLSVALYMLSTGIFPVWWSFFSENFGRRIIYLTSFALFVLWNALSGVATSLPMFIVMRVLSGGASASVQAVGAGTIADIWEVRQRGRVMGIFYIGPLCGPLLGPIVGGALAEGFGWRSTQWFLTIYAGFLLVSMLFFLPETLRASPAAAAPPPPPPSSPNGELPEPKPRSFVLSLLRGLFAPLQIVLYFRYPVVVFLTFYASWTFGCLYFINISITEVFSAAPYGYSTIIVGLLYIPSSLGYVFASLFGGRWIDWIMHRSARQANRYDDSGTLVFKPQDRMKENAWIAGILYPGALVWYGWTARYGLLWIIPSIANALFGIGSMLIFSMVTTMLTEYMPKKPSHGVAVNNLLRNTLACVATIVADPLMKAIGTGWLFTGLTVLSLVIGAMTILLMSRYGEKWAAQLRVE